MAAVSLLAGCGGGGGRLSRSDYAKQADAICSKSNVKLNAVARPRNQAELEKFVDTAAPLIKDASGQLKALKPPQDEQHTADAWNKANSDVVSALERLRDAAKAKDRGKMQAAIRDGNLANSHANTLARTLGMTACAK